MKKSSYLNNVSLPSQKDLEKLANNALSLSKATVSWKPLTDVAIPGTLIDFTDSKSSSKNPDIIVIPDLHGRTEFLKNILRFSIPEGTAQGLSVEEALAAGKIHLVFLGDALHTEYSTKERWHKAQDFFDKDNYTSDPMKQEMAEGLSVYTTLLDLLCTYPNNFFFLRGNHENIKNKSDGGMFSFKKYALEGAMTHMFMKEYYGQDILDLLEDFEDNLPLVYACNQCVISHAEPYSFFDKDSIIHGAFLPAVMNGLTWTNNNCAADDAVEKTMAGLLGHNKALWISGHRPVTDGYTLQRNGLFLQIHDPRKTNVLFVSSQRPVNIETDFWDVTPKITPIF